MCEIFEEEETVFLSDGFKTFDVDGVSKGVLENKDLYVFVGFYERLEGFCGIVWEDFSVFFLEVGENRAETGVFYGFNDSTVKNVSGGVPDSQRAFNPKKFRCAAKT